MGNLQPKKHKLLQIPGTAASDTVTSSHQFIYSAALGSWAGWGGGCRNRGKGMQLPQIRLKAGLRLQGPTPGLPGTFLAGGLVYNNRIPPHPVRPQALEVSRRVEASGSLAQGSWAPK